MIPFDGALAANSLHTFLILPNMETHIPSFDNADAALPTPHEHPATNDQPPRPVTMPRPTRGAA